MEVELSREECLANGMSEKEYDIQKALGSLPICYRMTWASTEVSLKEENNKQVNFYIFNAL